MKDARPVRKGTERKGLVTVPRFQSTLLRIFIDFNDLHSQAKIYRQLGNMAQEQRQFLQAEQYYQHALQLFIDYNDRYHQADTYYQLGRVAEEQRQWAQAREYFLQALEIYVSYQDTYSGGMALRSLARLWQSSGDASLPAAVASIVGTTPAEIEELLRSYLENKPGKSGS